MNITKKIIPVFFATDDRYVPFLCVALKSIADKASEDYEYHIHILHVEMPERSKQALQEFDRGNFKIYLDNVQEKLLDFGSELCTRDYYTKTTYYRLFIPNMFPNYDKAIYLDCDVTLNADISELYSFDLEGYYVGAIPDEVVQVTEIFIRYVERYLGVETKKYFNAGVMLMNLKMLREERFEERFTDLVRRIKFVVAQDQDYLNYICKGKVLFLPEIWNKMPLPKGGKKLEDIKLVHYNLSFKPWHYDGIEYEQLFWSVAKTTKFYDVITDIKNNFDEEKKQQDSSYGNNLMRLAEKFSLCGESETAEATLKKLC